MKIKNNDAILKDMIRGEGHRVKPAYEFNDLEKEVLDYLGAGLKGPALKMIKDRSLDISDGRFADYLHERGDVEVALEVYIQSYSFPQAADCAEKIGHKNYAKQLRHKAIDHEINECGDFEQAVECSIQFGFDDEVLDIARKYRFDDCEFGHSLKNRGYTEAAFEVFKQTDCFGNAGECAEELGLSDTAKKLYAKEVRQCRAENSFAEAADWMEKLADLGGCDRSLADDLRRQHAEYERKLE